MAAAIEKAKVTRPSETAVIVARDFRAPRDLVYKAYTTPALVTRWLLGPPGWTMPVCEMDVRVGGAYRWRWRSEADGQEFGFHGIFREVVPGAKLVHTELYDPGDVGGSMEDAGECLVTVEFTERAGITTMTTRMDFSSKEACDAAVATGMTDGMEMSYAGLDDLLPTL
ncbi:MAG: SRPBCC family protein [Hyphomonadaceae bacterium]